MARPNSLVGPLVGAWLVVASACAPRAAPPPATVTSTSASASASDGRPARELPPTGQAHALVIQATSCWLGGLWSDAVGERGEARSAGIQRRCDDLLTVLGERRDKDYYPLRAVDAATVDRLAEHIRRAALSDQRDRPHAAELVALLHAVAAASRETIRARRVADAVKHLSASSSADAKRATKIAAAPALRTATALAALLAYGGPYAADARLVGTLDGLDRLEIARGLPKHLKVYAVEGVNLALFGVAAPPLGDDASAPIPTGTWLAYLSAVAAAAGHPVPPDAKDPQNREPLAWNGVLEGIADRLRGAGGDAALEAVASKVVARLDQQAASARAAFDAHAPRDR